MDPQNFLHQSLFIAKSRSRGRGLFTKSALAAGTLIELAPVLVMSDAERILLDKTLLHDYIFEWGKDEKQCIVALGYVSIYNHSYTANCEYQMNFKKELIAISTVKRVPKGAELFINYNGGPDNEKKLWFDVK